MVTVKIDSALYHFIIELKFKVTRITGASGTGKTSAYDLLRDSLSNNKNPETKVTCPLKYIVMTGADSDVVEALFAKKFVDTVVYIDEGLYISDTGMIVDSIRSSINSYFIFVTREPLGWLSYDYRAINTFSEVSSNVFKLKQVYTEDIINANMSSFNKVITEDMCSGYQFFSEVFKLPVKSAGGKDNTPYCQDGALFIVDGAAYGSVIEKFLKQRLTYILYMPCSFEWLLFRLRIAGNYTFTNEEEYLYPMFASFEELCTTKLGEITLSYGFNYSKSRLPHTFKNSNNIAKARTALIGILKRGILPDA